MINKVDINRITLEVTNRCTLKCALCVAFAPYVKNPADLTLQEAQEVLQAFFTVVDSVGIFNLTGGEPLMNPDITAILKEVIKYRAQIRQDVTLVTNGTIVPTDEFIDLFAENKDYMRIVISDYGKLSYKIDEIRQIFDDREINYRVVHFNGDNLSYGGWIDFRDHSLKYDTKEARDEHSLKCMDSVGKYFNISDGEIHYCMRSFWRIKNGLIPKEDCDYVPLLDDSISLEDKRQRLMQMFDAKSVTSCAYCVGHRNDVERQIPAEQL